jgi:putative peptide zinc metalloprotease protein
MDGYYVVSDLIGVPNLFGQIKPTLRSFLPGRTAAGSNLKPWARVTVAAWVVTTIGVLTAILGAVAWNSGAIVRAISRALRIQLAGAERAIDAGRLPDFLVAGLQLALSAAVAAGLVATLVFFGVRAVVAARRRSASRSDDGVVARHGRRFRAAA